MCVSFSVMICRCEWRVSPNPGMVLSCSVGSPRAVALERVVPVHRVGVAHVVADVARPLVDVDRRRRRSDDSGLRRSAPMAFAAGMSGSRFRDTGSVTAAR